MPTGKLEVGLEKLLNFKKIKSMFVCYKEMV